MSAVNLSAVLAKPIPKGSTETARACIATAKSLNVPAMTADRSWQIPELGMPVTCTR
jgi:PIN domain nuclease of toxin-antitoxin system